MTLTQQGVEAAEALCDALGLPKDRVRYVTLDSSAPGEWIATVSLVVMDKEAGLIGDVMKRYHVTLTEAE